MKIKELLLKTYQQKILTVQEIDNILALALKRKRDYLYKNKDKELNISLLKTFQKLIKKRLNNIPFAYLKKKKEFYNLKFLVNKNTLIPRPESELIIDSALDYIKEKKIKNIKIIDIGTGSGCLIISLVKQLKKYQALALDINKKALKIAQTNARQHKVKITFLQSNLLTKVKKQNFNIILANLPYLEKKELKEPSIVKEPRQALYGHREGLKYYRELIKELANYLAKEFIVLFEINPTQKNKLDNLIKKELPLNKVEYLKDLNNNIRVLKIINK